MFKFIYMVDEHRSVTDGSHKSASAVSVVAASQSILRLSQRRFQHDGRHQEY